MSLFAQFDPQKQPRSKVELHVHLDGSVRLATIWELAQKKGISLGVKSFNELLEKCTAKTPCTLTEFLKPFGLISCVVSDDLAAIERMAYEFCEDSAKQGVLYSEVRYCPHLFITTNCNIVENEDVHIPSGDRTQITPTEVVKSVNKGLTRGQVDFKIKVRSILCCYRTRSDWSQEILNLCVEFKDQGVVGIDICGDESKIMASSEEISVFQMAAKVGIHRTAHAAEDGPAANAALAVKELKVERIGHGYHVVDDEVIYKDCLNLGIHFETCPYSSYLTSAVPLSTLKHPIIRFAEDGANFSLSRDDPFIIQKTLEQEYSLLRELGMRDVHFVRANLNAAKSCFLPEDEKAELLGILHDMYGMKTHRSSDSKNSGDDIETAAANAISAINL